MLFENTIVGPIHSRRLGSSLGVNLLPLKHKYCSYDCIYCECGWNRDSERAEMVYNTPAEIRMQLEQRLQELVAQGVPVDSLTFAGNGEPTLYPDFPAIVDLVCEMRDKYYPKAATTLLTNATQLRRPEIFNALKKLTNPCLKLDAGTQEMRELINRNIAHSDEGNTGCTWDELIDGLVRFGHDGIIQTLLFDGEDDEGHRVSNIIDEQFVPYLELLKKINPKFVMIYPLDRATPAKNLRKIKIDELNLYAERIKKEGIEVKVYG